MIINIVEPSVKLRHDSPLLNMYAVLMLIILCTRLPLNIEQPLRRINLYVQKGIQQKQPANVPNPEGERTQTGDAVIVAGNKR